MSTPRGPPDESSELNQTLRPLSKELGEFLNTSEIEKLAALEDNHWWYRERRALLGQLLRTFTTSGAALDIGAACGGNTRVLQDYGWKATALDFSAIGPVICRQRGIPAIRANATLLPIATASLDLVVAFDMLEHVDCDDEVVREVHRVLRPGGRFLVAVPCDPALWSAHDEAVQHRRRYTADQLNELISGNHFHISRMWSWNVLMRPLLKIRRHWLKGSDLDDVSPLVNTVLGSVIRLERYLPVSRAPGASLFVEAQALPSTHLEVVPIVSRAEDTGAYAHGEPTPSPVEPEPEQYDDLVAASG